MRVYVGFFILALAAASAAAQDTPPTPTQAAKVNAELAVTAASLAPTLAAARLNAELAAAGGWSTAMKNSPFSADEVNESIQTLADGNRIVRSSSGKMYRNGEGRVRRESKGGTGGSFGFTYSVTPSISILNPVDRQKYELDSALKTARIYDMGAGQNLTIAGANLKSADEALAKLKAEGKLSGTGEIGRASCRARV